MRLVVVTVMLLFLLTACVTRTVFVSEPVVSVRVDETPQQTAASQHDRQAQIRESVLYFDQRRGAISLRALILPAIEQYSEERVNSYQILIHIRDRSDISSIALRTPSRSFPLTARTLDSPQGTNFYIELSGENAAQIKSTENALLVFIYKENLVSAIITEHQLSNVIESSQ